MATPFIAEISMFAGNFAPRGWAFCNGQLISIAQNTALFSLIGTTYGGDGMHTFALPDLRGRVPVHPGQGPGLQSRDLGEMGGEESHTLTIAEVPAQYHPTQATINVASGHDSDAGLKASQGNVVITGGNQPHNNMQPFLAVNFIIAVEGIFPSRN